MKYDLIIVGAGPGGCLAARTAARDGLKVLLLEKSADIGRITRFCSRMMRIGNAGFSSDIVPTDVDIRRATVSFEERNGKHVIRLHGMPEEVLIDYAGEYGECQNKTWISPGGNSFNRRAENYNEGYVVDKDELMRGLVGEAVQAGCEVRVGTRCEAIEDTTDGVRLKVKSKAGEETLEARRAILADGSFSPLMEQLGFNEGRSPGRGRLKFMSYIVDRINSPFPEPRHLTLCTPSLHKGFVNIGAFPPGRWQIGVSASVASEVRLPEILDKFIADSPFTEIFAGAKVLSRQACNMDLRPAVREAARGNVICVGDNASYAEVAIKGAMGCGFIAARASKTAIEGGDGNTAYNRYWQHAFNFFSPVYQARNRSVKPIPSVLTDDEVDALYACIARNNISGMPNDIMLGNIELFRDQVPGVIEKIVGSGDGPRQRSAA